MPVKSFAKKTLPARVRSKTKRGQVRRQKKASQQDYCPCRQLKNFCAGIYGAIRRKRRKGFSMIEVLVVVALVSLFGTLGATTYQSSQVKSRDAARKGDLQSVRTAFEDYFNDHSCYPPAGAMSNCGSADLAPYLREIPCDPHTRQPYFYEPLEGCRGYRLLTSLENQSDPVIAELGCAGEEGCGYGSELNFGVASGVAVFNPTGSGEPPAPTPTPPAGSPPPAGTSPTPTPTPTSTPTGPVYVYACDFAGVCNEFEEGSPYLLNCPVTFEQSNCNNECHIPAFRCGG